MMMMLHIATTAAPPTLTSIQVAYDADRLCYEYLRGVLVPALGSECRVRHGGDTVLERFQYEGVDVFTRANRLTPLGALVPPGATLVWVRNDAKTSCLGNATHGDMTIVCPLCNDHTIGGCTDFELVGCAHRFHFLCLLGQVSREGTFARCAHPGCTAPFASGVENVRLRQAMTARLRSF